MKCPVCGSDDETDWHWWEDEAGECRVWLCNTCEITFWPDGTVINQNEESDE